MEHVLTEVRIALRCARDFSENVYKEVRLEIDLVLAKHGLKRISMRNFRILCHNYTVFPSSKKNLWQECINHFVMAFKQLLRIGNVRMFYDFIDGTLIGESLSESQFSSSLEYSKCVCFAGFLAHGLDPNLYTMLFANKSIEAANDVFNSWISENN